MQMRKMRWVAGLAALSMSLVGLSGCSNGSSEASDGPVTLTMWHGFTGSDGPALQKVIDSFNKSQKEVKVVSKVYPWDSLYDKFLTSVTSNTSPQIVAMSNSYLAQYAAKHVLTPTTDFYSSDKYMDTSALAKSAVSASKYQGVNYGVPLDIGPVMLYWNKDLFKAAGLDPEKPPTTWEEFEQYSEKLTVDSNSDGKPEQYAISIGDHETVPVFPGLFAQNGGRIVSQDGKKSELDSKATLEAANYWVKMVTEKHITPVGMSGSDADQLFQSGKAAMELNGPWLTTGLTDAKVNFGVSTPFKKDASSQVSVMTDTVSFAVPKTDNEQQKDAAYKFFAYWNSVKGQTDWANNSGFPSVRSDIPAESLTNQYTKVFGSDEVLKGMVTYMPGVPANQQIDQDIFTPALQKALGGNGTVDDLFKSASKEIQTKLDEAKD